MRPRQSPVESGWVTRTCRLEQIAGLSAICPEVGCPFWEPGGAVLEGRCAFERVDLTGRPEVALELLQLRRTLTAGSEAETREARHRFHRALNESADE